MTALEEQHLLRNWTQEFVWMNANALQHVLGSFWAAPVGLSKHVHAEGYFPVSWSVPVKQPYCVHVGDIYVCSMLTKVIFSSICSRTVLIRLSKHAQAERCSSAASVRELWLWKCALREVPFRSSSAHLQQCMSFQTDACSSAALMLVLSGAVKIAHVYPM